MHTSNRNWVSILSLPLLACLPLACASEAGESTNPAPTAADRVADSVALSQVVQYASKRTCSDVAVAGEATCFARIRTSVTGAIEPLATQSGWGPADLLSAYNVPSSTSTATIAIVDAQDDPNAEADLGVYRSNYGLSACTTANGCFKKVNQTGGTSYPAASTNWAPEIALDIEMASAACPTCKILLVEATSASFANLAAAVNEAATLGATVISNSYGGGESSSETTFDASYNHAGVAVFASTGDSGYGTSYPATGKGVIGVGGTTLAKSTSTRGWAETVWNGAGSGCSSVEAKPTWQTDTGCTRRTVGDLSAVADPNTGVAVYDSYASGGWAVYGGTSVASPLVASIFASIGKGSKDGSFVWSNTGDFYDVTSGSNGSCSGSYLCTGIVGFDGPTGWGTPNATALAAAP
ncbi:MAG TPA: hypothetical protein VNO21_18240 [Polyangiaceae bacterium]|nr:hypothetical protein [Polyangiaceae bacterium]